MPINYLKLGWDVNSFVNPTRMNHMEDGIQSCSDGVDGLLDDVGTLQDEVSTKASQTEVTAINEALSDLGKCKNLLNPTLSTTTKNGITCTNNGDGTYTFNGTASVSTFFNLSDGTFQNIKSGTYKIIGCPNGGSASKYALCLDSESERIATELGSGIEFTLSANTDVKLSAWIGANIPVNNLIFKPMLTTNLNATYDDFVPYTGNSETLTHDVASINASLSDYGLVNVFDGKLKQGQYDKTTGIYRTNNYFCTPENALSCSSGASILVKFPTDACTIAFYNSSGTYISGADSGTGKNGEYTFIAPSNSASCRVNFWEQSGVTPSNIGKVSIYIDNAIEQIKADLSDAWNSSKTYAVGEYCISDNGLWKCKVQHSNQKPSEGTYWTRVTVMGELISKSVTAKNIITTASGLTVQDNSYLYIKNNRLYGYLEIAGTVTIDSNGRMVNAFTFANGYKPKTQAYASGQIYSGGYLPASFQIGTNGQSHVISPSKSTSGTAIYMYLDYELA